MNILYHRKDFIVCLSPPDPPRIDDENTLQGALEGEREIRVLTTAATSRSVEAGRASITEQDFDPSMLVRSETIRGLSAVPGTAPAGNQTQLFSVPAEEIREIYALSDHIEYVSPYQAAIRAYVEYRFKETQVKLDDGAVVAMVDIQGSVAFITFLDGDLIEVFRFVAAENLATEFHRTVEYYLQTHIDQSLFLIINSHEAAGELISASGTPIGGPDVIPETCPALIALNALEVTPRFLLPEIEARKEMARQRAKSLVHLSFTGTAAAVATVVAMSAYLSSSSNFSLAAREDALATHVKAELSAEAERKFPSLIRSVQPRWHEVITEIALVLPQWAKIEELTIADTQTGINTGTRMKQYAVNMRFQLADPDPIAAGRTQALLNEKLKTTKYLKDLKAEVLVRTDGKVNLLLKGLIRKGEIGA